jgi:glutathione S-transferase
LQGQDLAAFPNLKQWYKAIEERPAVQRGVAVMAGGLALQPSDKRNLVEHIRH